MNTSIFNHHRFFVAGHESTASSLSWCLYALALDKRVQQKLREELLSIPTDSPCMDDLMSLLPCLKTVTLETADARDVADLEERLILLRASGRVRRRTCEEAQQICRSVLTNSYFSHDSIQGVIAAVVLAFAQAAKRAMVCAYTLSELYLRCHRRS